MLDSKKKVVIAASTFYPLVGGMEKQALHLSKLLSKKGVLLHVLTSKKHNQKNYEKINEINVFRLGVSFSGKIKNSGSHRTSKNNLTWYEENKIKKESLQWRIKHFFYLLVLFFQITLHLLRFRKQIDTIICFSFTSFDALVILISRLLRIKTIARAANSDKYLFVNINFRYLVKQILKADKYIAISSVIKKELLSLGIEDNKIYLIPNSIEIPNLIWNYNNKKIYDASLVGNFSQQPLKGIDVLVRAWKIVILRFPDAILNLCGNGNSTPIKELIKELGIESNVVFSNNQKNVVDDLLKSKLFILPSRYEGMSNALLEAMALGMPCIATNISGSNDLIINYKNGILVESENYEQMADAICFLLSNPNIAAEYASNARKTITDYFTFDKIDILYLKMIYDKRINY